MTNQPCNFFSAIRLSTMKGGYYENCPYGAEEIQDEAIVCRHCHRRLKAPAEPACDNKAQLDFIKPYVIRGEILMGVYDCRGAGTSFVGITDRRLVFYDQGVVFKKKSIVSIPYNQVIALASTDEGIVIQTSEIILTTAAGKFSFEFRGAEKAHWAYPQLPG